LGGPLWRLASAAGCPLAGFVLGLDVRSGGLLDADVAMAKAAAAADVLLLFQQHQMILLGY